MFFFDLPLDKGTIKEAMQRSDNTTILQQVPLLEFFRDRVREALNHHQLTAAPMTEFYLANLLSEFKKSETLFNTDEGEPREEVLALMLAKAVESDSTTRIRMLKRLGDISLYTAGFFKPRVENKLVGLRYYIRMGGGAYHNLASILESDSTFSGLYTELAQLFPHLVNALTFVSTQASPKTNKRLIDLYEQWLATGDTSLEGILNDAGIPTHTEFK